MTTVMKSLGWFRRTAHGGTYKIDEVAPYLQSNPFIRTGYRGGNMGFLACAKSALAVHNETINIWTHLLGFVTFLGLLVYDLNVIPYARVGPMDLLVLIGLLVCYQVS